MILATEVQVASPQVQVQAQGKAQIASNNFDFLRLMAALMVVYGHGQDLKGLAPPLLWNTQVSSLGLDIFFCISGYLVTDSWERGPDLGRFLAKRALRIFPALVVVVVAGAFLLGPLVTTLPPGKYLLHAATWRYLYNIGLYLELSLPDVFQNRLLGGAVNGSLWSLFPEFLCYLTVPVLAVLPGWLRIAAVATLGAAFGVVGLHLFDINWGMLVYHCDLKYLLIQVPFFFAGSLVRLLQERGAAVFRMDVAIPLALATYGWTELPGPWNIAAEWVALSYLVIAFGRTSTPMLQHAAMFGDLSYGMYLYAFPLQQLVLEHRRSYAIIICTLLSALCALVSWHLVEQPFLRLKPGAGSAILRPGGP